MSAVTVPVADASCLVHEVPSVQVVFEAVAVVVIVFSTFRLLGVSPDVCFEVGVVDVHTRIENCYYRSFLCYDRLLPQLGQLHGLQSPLLTEERVVVAYIFTPPLGWSCASFSALLCPACDSVLPRA